MFFKKYFFGEKVNYIYFFCRKKVNYNYYIIYNFVVSIKKGLKCIDWCIKLVSLLNWIFFFLFHEEVILFLLIMNIGYV